MHLIITLDLNLITAFEFKVKKNASNFTYDKINNYRFEILGFAASFFESVNLL